MKIIESYLYGLLNFNGIHRNLLLSHMEDFKIVIHSWVFDFIFILFHFRITVHFHTQVVAALLPMYFTVGDGEQVLRPDLSTVGKLEQCYSGRYIFVFSHPVSNNIVSWWPAEVSVNTNILQVEYKIIKIWEINFFLEMLSKLW